MMKANGYVSLCSPINHDENQIHSSNKSSPSSSTNSSSSRRPSGPFQIKLRNPPAGRRTGNGTHTNSNSPTQTVNSLIQDQSPVSDQPPPIPPRYSLVNTTNKPLAGQWPRPGVTPIKAPRTIFRSRNVKRRDANTLSTNLRSDSADALSAPVVERRKRHSIHRLQVQNDPATNSD